MHTTDPIFIAKRLIESVLASKEGKISILMLDWAKAFDKVDQKELINAVKRMNVPEETTKELEQIYECIKFCIKDREGLSTERHSDSQWQPHGIILGKTNFVLQESRPTSRWEFILAPVWIPHFW